MRTPRRLATALAFGALLVGCGQQQSQRARIADYLKKVNRIEAALAQPLSTVTATGNRFAQEQSSGGSLTDLVYASNEQELERAAARISAEQTRLAALRTPHPAEHLRSLLLQIMHRQLELTREVGQLVVFLPHYGAALRPLGAATKRLEVALTQQTAFGPAAVAEVYVNKAAALRTFRAELERVLKNLYRLTPPAVSKPGFDSQVSALQGMSSSAGQLASALQGGPHGNIQQLLAEFNRAAASNQTVAAVKAQIAAVRAYDGESTRLQQLSQAAEAERLRLSNTLA